MEIDDLYQQYCSRLKRSLLVTSLLLNVVYVIILLGWHSSVENPLQDRRNIILIAICALEVAIVTGFTFLSCVEPLFNKAALPISLLIWTCLLTFNLTYHAFLPLRTCSDGLVQNFVLILVTYIALPLPWIPTVISGALTAILQIIVPAVIADFRFLGMGYQIAANIIVVICANVLGLYHKYQHDVTNARTFLDARNCIESRIKLEHEQRQQEELLHSVLPVHLTVELRNKMLERLKIASIDTHVQQKRSAYGRFHDVYMRVHDNVTILYADIVNFTPLAALYTAAELVMVLNQLFGKFDNLAQDHDCLRIKILGDCYYCVSGLPVSRPSHAANCVRMGLAMILAIREIRNVTNLDVDMRIGAHTGSVVSGVLGLHKWQYDVWSDDVIIANHMESAGKPGVVHISKATLLHLNEEFQVKPADGHLRSSFLRERNIETFFITPAAQTTSKTLELPALTLVRKPSLHRTLSRGTGAARMSQFVASWGMPKPFASLTDAPGNLTDIIQQSCISMMESNLLLLSCAHPFHCTNNGDIHCAHLAFKKPTLEAEFTSQEDPSFHYYVLAAGTLFLFLTTLHVLVLNSNMIFILSFILGGSILAVMLVFSLLSLLHASADLKRSWWSPVTEIFHQIISMAIARTGMAVFAIIIMAALSVVTLIDSNKDSSTISSTPATNITILQQSYYFPMAPYYVLSMLLALVCASLFFQLHFLLKCGLMALAAILDSVLLFVDTTSVFRNYSVFLLALNPERFNGLDLRLEALLFIITLLVILHILDRQTEYTIRVDFLWKNTFTLDREEAEVMASLNKVLLQNILPTHVAEHFLTARHKNEDMYHESYSSACVMFASISNFWDFYRQTTVTKYGVECLKVLNEIISDFDQLLSKPKFSGIEKIKTIGSTYMAASGLRPGRHKRKEVSNGDQHVVALVDFALAMMSTLDGINKDTLNNFQLRIGINNGPVMAGVIGAQKPQYDIWGDTVNVASRMDSCGLQGRIQCPESTASLLMAAGYDCECRGVITVKGKKEPMETYLLPRISSPKDDYIC